jgi:hypothetical protein
MLTRPPGPSRVSCAGAVVALAAIALSACAGSPPRSPSSPATALTQAPALAKPVAPIAPPEGPPVTMLPASTARSLELAAISVTSVDRLLANGATLVGAAVPLPIDPAGLRDMLLGQAGLSPEIAANLDLGSPSGAAVVATGRGAETGLVMAVAARGPAEAERVIGALGKVVARRGAVVLIDNGSGGRGWVFRAGNVVVLSDDVDALARGAMLALEARHPAPDDVTAILYPDVIARAYGTDVKTAIAAVLEAVSAAQAAQRAQAAHAAGADKDKKAKGKGPAAPPAPATDDHSLEALGGLLTLMGDAETVDVGLAVDPTRGMVVRARLHPHPGTALAAVAREAHPFEIDRGVLEGVGGGPPALAGASSNGPFFRDLMLRQRERLAAQGKEAKGGDKKAAAAALTFFDAMLAALAGQQSVGCTLAGDAPHFSAALTYALRDAATAAKLAAALAGLDRAAAVALWNAQVGSNPMFDWAAKKETVGKLKALHYTLAFRKDAAGAEDVTRILGRTLEAYATVAGTRFLVTVGQGAKARLTTLAAAKAAPQLPQGPLGEALTAATGRDGFFYFDLGAVLSLVGTYAQDPRAAMLAHGVSLPIPLYGTAGGDGVGKVWTIDLTLPPAAFTGAGAVIQRMSAGSAGGP